MRGQVEQIRSFHEKADPGQEFFSLSMIFPIFPFSQAASV
jgi:hypothetical protein